MSVALKKREFNIEYGWLCKMSIATIDAWSWCAHVESMKATLNQRQRETERCLPRSNCLRMDWRSSTDCCHGNSAGRSWALDHGKSACLAAFVASLNFSEGAIRCKIVAADFAAEEIPEVSRNNRGLFGTWMIDHQGLAFLWEKIYWSVFFSTDWDSVFDNVLGTWNLVVFYGILHVLSHSKVFSFAAWSNTRDHERRAWTDHRFLLKAFFSPKSTMKLRR